MKIHTFDKGYFCKADGLKLNDNINNRSGYCKIIDQWKRCDECKYFSNKNW